MSRCTRDSILLNSCKTSGVSTLTSIQPPPNFKVIVIGDAAVGKTCLALRLCNGYFNEHTPPTIGVDFPAKMIKVGEMEVKLQIWDTAGQERYRFHSTLSKQYYRNVSAVVFVYDVTNSQSFDNLKFWVDECERQFGRTDELIKVLIGNKSDKKNRNSIPADRAQQFAEFHRMEYFETSAKDDRESEYIERIFAKIADQLVNGKHPPLDVARVTPAKSKDSDTCCR